MKYILPRHVLLMIYNSLILPHLNYCVLVWGYENKRLYKLQKKAVRILSLEHRIAHSDPLFEKLQLLKIRDIHTLQQLIFFFKLSKHRIPYFFKSFTFRRNADVHNYSTRQKHNLRPEKLKQRICQKNLKT